MNSTLDIMNLPHPLVMGILNASPDSFYKQHASNDLTLLQDHVDKLIVEGADIIDIGGMTSKPHSEEITIEEEMKRCIPIIEYIRIKYPNQFISIDTYRGELAETALQMGVQMVNDISGGMLDKNMASIIKKYDSYYVCMHMKGKPKDMQLSPFYQDVVKDVYHFFEERLAYFHSLSIRKVILDVGFGFGKTIKHNYELLNGLRKFTDLQMPILVGISRKSMIYKLLNIQAEDALSATSALHLLALQQGANILRVHDVVEAKQCIGLYQQIKKPMIIR